MCDEFDYAWLAQCYHDGDFLITEYIYMDSLTKNKPLLLLINML